MANAVGPLNKKLAEIDVLLPCIIELEKKISDLESCLLVAQEESKHAMEKANNNEQYSQKYNIHFVGIEENASENCTDLIIEFCREKLEIAISADDIARAHHVGSKTEGKTRAIIVKFMNYSSKMRVLYA